MNSAEQSLEYPLGDRLAPPGGVLEIAPGILWVRMPLPFALDHINLWLLRDSDGGREGWTLVDTGIGNDITRAHWESIFSQHLEGLPILRLIVTHMHPDHIGLADWLCQRWSSDAVHECRMWISGNDFSAARSALSFSSSQGGASTAAFMKKHGLTNTHAQEQISQRGNYYASMVPGLPAAYRRLMHGMRLNIGGHSWQCWVGYGHAPEHMSLWCESLDTLISGDMVLPRISTNVSVLDIEPEGNPLQLYLEALRAMEALPKSTLVLPSHGRPFRGLHTRLGQLQAHHDERLKRVITHCQSQARTAADLLPVLFSRALDMHQMTFAMGEAIAHLHALWHQGVLVRSVNERGEFVFQASVSQ